MNSPQRLTFFPFNILPRHIKPNEFVVVFLVALVALLAFRPESLFNPPYWDAILGPFYEGYWLADHNFDYVWLARYEPDYGKEGARVYFFTIYPGIQAILAKVIPEVGPRLFILHMITRLLAAGAVSSFYRLLRRTFSVSYAVMGALVFVSCPLFLSQVTMINMEIFLVIATLAAWNRFLDGRHIQAAVCMIAAYAVKFSSVYVACGFLALYVLTQLKTKKDLLRLAFYAAPLGFFFVQSILGSFLFTDPLQGGGLDLENFQQKKLVPIVKSMYTQSPVLFMMAALSLLVAAVYVVVVVFSRIELRARWLSWGPWNNLRAVIAEHASVFLCLGLGVVFAFVSISYGHFLPRYFFLQLPMTLTPFFLVGRFRKNQLMMPICISLIAVQVINHRGFIDRKLSDVHEDGNNGFILERSMEYEADMKMNREMCRWLEEHYADTPIIASWPITHMLTDPRLGYVTKPMHVVCATRSAYHWKETTSELEDYDHTPEALNDMVWATSRTYLGRSSPAKRKARGVVEEVKVFVSGDRKAVIYRRPVSR
jgi:hypothetical protein